MTRRSPRHVGAAPGDAGRDALADCWDGTWASGTRLRIAPGAATTSSRAAERRSSSPPTRAGGRDPRRGPAVPEAAGQRDRAVRGPEEPEPARAPALHPDLRVVARPGRGVLRDHHPPGNPSRLLRGRHRTHRHNPRLHRRLERSLSPLHLDQDRRRVLPHAIRERDQTRDSRSPGAAVQRLGSGQRSVLNHVHKLALAHRPPAVRHRGRHPAVPGAHRRLPQASSVMAEGLLCRSAGGFPGTRGPRPPLPGDRPGR